MEPIMTHVALGDLGDLIGVFSEFYGERAPLKNERMSEESPFIKYVNSRTLPELMIALDDLYEEFGMTDFISDLFPGNHRPVGTSGGLAEKVCGWFGDDKPTRTTLEKTREALAVWSIDRAKPKYAPTINGKPGSMLYLFTPLEDIIKAREDLRRASLLMAWLLGKTDFQTAHGLPAGDKKARLRLFDAEEPVFLHDYYEKLKNNTGNTFLGFNTHMAIDQMHLYAPESIESAVHSYVVSTFGLLMSDQRKMMNEGDLTTYNYSHTILSAAWSYFSDGLSKDEGAGSISVCKHCHRFFEQQRKTRQFCSDSCRVMYMRAHSGEEPEEEPFESQVMKFRKAMREQQAANAR